MDNQQINNNPQQAKEPGVAPANGWYKATVLRRWVASIVDGFIFLLIALVLILISKSTRNSASGLLQVLSWIYSVFFVWRFGATLGKKLLKIQVVDTNYQPVSLWKAFLREVIGKFLSGIVFSLGYLWAIWDKDRQTWHDKIAGTYVVTKIPNNGKNSVVIFIVIALITFFSIIAILAAVVVLIINPVELMKRSRDAERLTNLTDIQETINSAQIADPKLSFCFGAKSCDGQSNASDSSVNKMDGSGWVKIALGKIVRTGATLLPIDPLNNEIYYYRYCSDGKDWEIEAKLESDQQKPKMASDGGVDPNMYEIGSKFGLCK